MHQVGGGTRNSAEKSPINSCAEEYLSEGGRTHRPGPRGEAKPAAIPESGGAATTCERSRLLGNEKRSGG